MNRFSNTFKRTCYKIQDFFPTQLPVGLTAYNKWCDRLLFTYFPEDVKPPSQDSFQFSIAAMVMHLDSQKPKVPNRFFGKAIRKGAANEVASFVMQSLKSKRDALVREQEEQALKNAQLKLAEATANTARASNVHPIQEF